MKYVRDIPFKEFVDSYHKAVDEDLAELNGNNFWYSTGATKMKAFRSYSRRQRRYWDS